MSAGGRPYKARDHSLMIMAMTEMTTKYGPHGHVQAALNFISLRGRP